MAPVLKILKYIKAELIASVPMDLLDTKAIVLSAIKTVSDVKVPPIINAPNVFQGTYYIRENAFYRFHHFSIKIA